MRHTVYVDGKIACVGTSTGRCRTGAAADLLVIIDEIVKLSPEKCINMFFLGYGILNYSLVGLM